VINQANAEIVNKHTNLPLSNIHGQGVISSSDAQKFAITASSLISSFYPRYFGYYEKAIGIYTHVSDQYSVFNTKVISCAPREALYVLDGLLENNTILEIKEHTIQKAILNIFLHFASSWDINLCQGLKILKPSNFIK
jgi:TnpA family transposase